MMHIRNTVAGIALVLGLLTAATTSGAERSESRLDAVKLPATDWPWWRGPQRNGIAAADQHPPLKWSETENVIWKSPVPGRGHGSPTVVGDQIFLATAEQDREVQSVLCFDRNTGKRQWQTDVHKGAFDTKGNNKSSHASSTIACDGQKIYVNFLHAGAIYTTALDRDGKQVWQTKIADYVLHQGFGSSPAVYGSLLLVSADNKGGAGAIAALDRKSGEIVWKEPRPKFPNYTSPIVLNIGGRDQLLFTGCELVTSFDPLTGKKLWEIEGSTTECVTSTVTDGKLIFTSGGYPTNHISAIAADGSGKVVWKNNIRVYVPSMLVRDGYLYTVLDAGVAMCWKSDTGEEVWKGRIEGTFSASPKAFKLLETNELGSDVYATPTFVDSRIYMRVAAQNDGKREESLYCIGAK